MYSSGCPAISHRIEKTSKEELCLNVFVLFFSLLSVVFSLRDADAPKKYSEYTEMWEGSTSSR